VRNVIRNSHKAIKEKNMRNKWRIVFAIIFICFLLYFSPLILGGYSYSENTAIRKSYPFQNGEMVFKESFGSKKVVIWDTGREKYVKLVNRRGGILYHVDNITDIGSVSPDELIRTTWTASLTKDKRYDTIFGAEVLNGKIAQIIVSNDKYGDKLVNKEDIKMKSSVYIEMPVKNGYAASYSSLPIQDAGGFVFRGVDEEGHIITFNQ
jgi:hypothetical protein